MKQLVRITRENFTSLLFLTVVFGSLYLSQVLTVDVESLISDNPVMSVLVLIALMYAATVLAPITVLPLIPVVAPMLGPFVTGLASWIGWTGGAITAFWIARYGGRPLVSRVADMEKLARLESHIPENAHFFAILALRLILPVDVLSYALGIFSTVHAKTHAIASALGIMWFSFAFAYLGYAFDSNNTVLFGTYSVASLIIFLTALWYARRAFTRR